MKLTSKIMPSFCQPEAIAVTSYSPPPSQKSCEFLLLNHLPNCSNTLAKRLFNGPLSSFAAKIDLAYALNLIENETHRDLRTVVDIRNEFAHSRKFLNFLSPEMVKLCRKFKGWHPEANNTALFDERVSSAQKAIKEKFDALTFAHAIAD
jgi:hypothetical protein